MNEALIRQSGIIPEAVLSQKINIIGCGAVGGWTALALAKMGFLNLTVFDFDTVDIENMSSQFFRHKDIGKSKAVALRDLVEDFTGYRIHAVPEKWERGPLSGIVIAAVDSMEVRKRIWDEHKDKGFQTDLLIDPRMGAESALMYAMRPMNQDDVTSYEKTLYTDANAVNEPCTAKATVYCATMLSGLVARTVKGFCVDKVYPRSVQWDIKNNAFQAWSNK